MSQSNPNLSSAAEASGIPIVDFAKWDSSASAEQKREIANQLTEACKTVGFVYIVNHAVSPRRLAEAFAWAKKLFDLKREEKMLAPHPNGSAVHRGYSWPGLEKVSDLMGDEDDADAAKNARQVSDVKVGIFSGICSIRSSSSPRKATRSVAKATVTSPTSGCRKMYSQASENLPRNSTGNATRLPK